MSMMMRFSAGSEIADFVAELGRVFGGELAVAFDDGGAFDAVGLDAEGVGEDCRIRRGLGRVGHVAAPRRNAVDYSGLSGVGNFCERR